MVIHHRFWCLLVIVLISTTAIFADSVKEADRLIESKDITNIKASIAILEKTIEERPLNGEAQWTMAKAHLYLGDRVIDGKLEIFEAGKAYAEKAVQLLPNSADAHFWLSALIGRVGQTRGVLQSLFMVNPLKKELDIVLEIDPNYAAAYFALSVLYTEAPGRPLSIGSKEKALENAWRSVDLDPDNIEHNVNLAKVLINNKKTKEALEVLNNVLAMPHIDTEVQLKEEAIALLKKHK